MPHVLGLYDDARGEPSRTWFRHVLLKAMKEVMPWTLPDLRDRCLALSLELYETIRPKDEPMHVFDAVMWQTGDERLRRVNAMIGRSGTGEVLERAQTRAILGAELWDALLEWGADRRITNDAGDRNPWLLEVAVHTLLDWCEASVDAETPETDLDWYYPGAPIGGDMNRLAPEFRRRAHPDPEPGSELGPLARDFRWLVSYTCTDAIRSSFAPGVARATVVQQVRAAADLIEYDLPDPLRPR